MVIAAVAALMPGAAWAVCGPDAPPAAAAARGFTCETFWSGPFSLSDIDTTDSGAPGFKWYTHNAWPFSPDQGVTATLNPTPATDYSVSGGNLTILPVSNAPYFDNLPLQLNSCRTDGTAHGWVGFATTGPAWYVEWHIVSAAAGRGPSPPVLWTSWWMEPIEYWTLNPINTPLGSSEFDFYEGNDSNPEDFYHWYLFPVPGHPEVVLGTAVNSGNPNLIDGMLNLPAYLNPNNDNATTGRNERYNNNVIVSANTLIYGNNIIPTLGGVTQGSTVGAFKENSSHHYCLQMGAGPGLPLVVQSVRVWEPLPPPASRRRIFH